MATTYLLCTGKIVGGAIEMDVAIPPFMLTKHAYIEYLCGVADDEPMPNGTLQRLIDDGEAVADKYARRMERIGRNRFDGSIEDDEEWIRRGC